MPLWMQTVGGILGFLILLGTAWRTVIRPLVKLAGTAERAAPALDRIAADFPLIDGASTLTQRLSGLEEQLAEISASNDRCEALLTEHVREHHGPN